MIKKIIRIIVKHLDSKKAENIVTLDIKKITTISDYFIIASANSETHLKTLAKDTASMLKKEFKYIPLNPITEDDKNWILLDYQDFIIHLFLEETRVYYNLEDLWFEAKKI
ncbi:MAG: ribosome silencing factor [Spirochaetes bacterium]|nr:ribosome silencing factor [Spirochaetota bacterium]